MNPLILIIEDEAPIRKYLSASFVDAGYRVNEAASGEEGLRLAVDYPPDLVVLDLGLPGIDGQEVIQQLRQWLRVPIIVLSARDQEAQKILALDHGADDYVTKPFGTGELLARIRAALRHAASSPTGNVVTFGTVRVDLAARTVHRNHEIVHLTPLEYKLLVTMIRHTGKVLTHRFLLREVWGPNDVAEPHYVRVFMANLRRKLEEDSARPQFFLTEPGVGYRFHSAV
ncbi:MAG: response regulator [Pirellulaceae bacterium]|nr:response regulator [Pirellulaceae bacterium]